MMVYSFADAGADLQQTHYASSTVVDKMLTCCHRPFCCSVQSAKQFKESCRSLSYDKANRETYPGIVRTALSPRDI